MSLFNNIFDKLGQLDPTMLWVSVFIILTLVGGIVSGFFQVRRIQPKGFKWKQIRTEVIVIPISLFLSTSLLGGLTWLLGKFDLIAYHDSPAAWWVILLEYAAYFLLFDTWFYWWHRAMHKEPMYKYVHKLHHLSTSPNLLTTLSINPLESLINGGFLPLFTAAVTLHRDTMVFIGPTSIIMGFYVHSGYEFLPRWWNRSWFSKWFITATFHDQHHKYFNYNFGGYTPIWDYICGTVRSKYEHDFENPRGPQAWADRKAAKRTAREGALATDAASG